jgi:triphosphoribosyl-dephospho-CoA synthetase
MKGIIYQIRDTEHPEIRYIGSTTQELKQRWQNHQSYYRTLKKKGATNSRSIYKYMLQYGIENYVIEVLGTYEVIDSSHLRVYEQLWMKKLPNVNEQSAFGMEWLRKHVILQQKKKEAAAEEADAEARRVFWKKVEEGDIILVHRYEFDENRKLGGNIFEVLCEC